MSVGVIACGDTITSSAPEELTVTVASESELDVSWSLPETIHANLDHYTLYRDGLLLVTLSGTAYADTGLIPGTTYCYAVTATDVTDNESYATAQVCGTTDADATAPDAPTGLSVEILGSDEVYLQWSAASDAVGVTQYYVYVDSSLYDATTGTDMTVSGLVAETEYCFSVTALDAAGNESDASGEVCATTSAEAGLSGGPTGLIVNALSSWRIDLSWDPLADDTAVASYAIFNGISGTLIDNAPATSYSHTGLANVTSYCYFVVAVDDAGAYSSPSSTKCAKTKDDQYLVGGSVFGLSSEISLTLDVAASPLAITADGPFHFPDFLEDGDAYTVTSDAASCTVTNGSGTIAGADVTDVLVTCE
jgi:chitodextrinase